VDEFNEAVNHAQSVVFFTLVVMQWGNLISTRTRRLSFFQAPPLWGASKNFWIPGAMFMSIVFAIFFSYPPFFQSAFLTRVRMTIRASPVLISLGREY
jgi:sodium/potassium-transporting ATPase subunit alpha